MLPKNIQYGILAVGAILAVVMLAKRFWPERTPDPPEVLQQRILESDSVETRAQAARDMVEHGKQARGFASKTLAEYQGNERQVLIPLIQAAQDSRDWRCMPRLFELMESDDMWIRGRAGAAARVILGGDYGFRANGSTEERAKALADMRRSFADNESAYEKHYSDPD